jgi:hypothetical protein
MARRLALLTALAAVAAALLAPAPAPATGGLVRWLAAGECVELKQKIGRKAFRKRFGRRAMPACIKRNRAAARRAVGVATAECRAELDEWGLELFLEDWLSFEECVATYAEWELDGGFEDETGEEEDPGAELPEEP